VSDPKTPTPVTARTQLDAAIRAEQEPSSPKTGKFSQLRELFAGWLSLPVEAVAPLYVSKPANLDNRAGQPGASGKRVAVTVLKPVERDAGESPASYASRVDRTLGSYENRAKVVVGSGIVGSLVLCWNKAGEGEWNAIRVVEPKGGTVGSTLKTGFPQISIVNPTTTLPEPSAQEDAPESSVPPADAADLAETLLVDDAWLKDVLWMLHDKKALVLYGPPGTGKTFIAQKLAAHIQPDSGRRRVVQMHPSYSYEDFFEGYRPCVVGDKATLRLEPGPLRQLAKLATDNPSQPVVLVIDEMNRALLPRVFGELFFLLEYRNESAALMYSPTEQFHLPKNLYVIGTMNTADRSIALIDQALRRRFHFAPLFPGEPPVDQMLRRFLKEYRPEMLWVADVLDRANEKLNDRHSSIGPSHFMRNDLDEEVLRKVWRASVLPTLEEHFFGQSGRLKEFELDRLRA